MLRLGAGRPLSSTVDYAGTRAISGRSSAWAGLHPGGWGAGWGCQDPWTAQDGSSACPAFALATWHNVSNRRLGGGGGRVGGRWAYVGPWGRAMLGGDWCSYYVRGRVY